VEIYQFYCLSKPSGVFISPDKKRESDRRQESKQETEIVRMKEENRH
jgi:hypothetical protein